uniref:Uncharacterized protein n=1 Tax=Arundo donax TaxID=35708 RepID=A0A0A9BAW7_ARUDO
MIPPGNEHRAPSDQTPGASVPAPAAPRPLRQSRARKASPSSHRILRVRNNGGLPPGARCRGRAPRRTLGMTRQAWRRPPRTQGAPIRCRRGGRGEGRKESAETFPR